MTLSFLKIMYGDLLHVTNFVIIKTILFVYNIYNINGSEYKQQ
jgi:hypothetical protein